MYFLYILRCADNSLYTGITTNIPRRIREHSFGNKGARYTRSRLPVSLVYSKKFRTRSLAQKEEYRIKQLTKGEKELLCALR